MKRWLILAAMLILFTGSVATALAPSDLLPGDSGTELAAPRPVDSGEVDKTGYIKGFYISAAALGSQDFTARMQQLLENTELNAVVMDFKNDRGFLTFPTEVSLAKEVGADSRTIIKDPAEFMSWFKQRNIYTIARIVVFKDNLLAKSYPGWAVTDANTGSVWHDKEGMGWIDGMQSGAWDYNIQLALEAASLGFDEVQFDYVRFPTDGNVTGALFSQPNTSENRSSAIAGLLSATKTALAPTGTKLAADVFGYTAWVDDDLGIGQHIEAIAPYLDVISPMVYPSTFDTGLPGEDRKYRDAIAYPYEVLKKSTERTVKRAQAVNPSVVIRPWVQDFQDYAFDGRIYTPAEIRQQIDGAREGGARGWLLWDPSVRYTQAALVTAKPSYVPDSLGQVPVLAYREPAAAATDPAVAEQSAQALRADLDWLRERGFYPASLSDLVSGGLRSVPAGKRPVVLTFDGAANSQFRMVGGGALDPNSTVALLLDYSNQHPADWPLRGTFLVRPIEGRPDDTIFGTAEVAEIKLQKLAEWGLELAVEPVGEQPLDQLDGEATQRALGLAQQQMGSWVPGYQATLLGLPGGIAPSDPALLAAGSYAGAPYSYAGAVLPDGGLARSPLSADFDPYRIPRIPAGVAVGSAWRDILTRPRLYVSGGE